MNTDKLEKLKNIPHNNIHFSMHLNHLSWIYQSKKRFKQKLRRDMNHTFQAACLLLVFSQLTKQQTDRFTAF